MDDELEPREGGRVRTRLLDDGLRIELLSSDDEAERPPQKRARRTRGRPPHRDRAPFDQ